VLILPAFYPTVARGTGLMRFAVSALHQQRDLESAAPCARARRPDPRYLTNRITNCIHRLRSLKNVPHHVPHQPRNSVARRTLPVGCHARPRLGQLLATALAVHPDPHIPFIRTGRPVINTAGEEQTEFTLAQLDALVQSWSVWYHDQGVGPRDRVALYIADSFAYSIHLYALAQLGAIPVLINSNASPALALGLCERTTPVGIYTDRSRLAAISEGIGSLDGLRWVHLAEDLPAPPPAELPDAWRFRHAPEDPVSIMHSSGTTGHPRR